MPVCPQEYENTEIALSYLGLWLSFSIGDNKCYSVTDCVFNMIIFEGDVQFFWYM